MRAAPEEESAGRGVPAGKSLWSTQPPSGKGMDMTYQMIDDFASLNLPPGLRHINPPLRCSHRDGIHVDYVFTSDADAGCSVGGCGRCTAAVTIDTDMLAPIESFACMEPSTLCV